MIEGITAHCYLVVNTNLTLIDTGLPYKTKKILRYITDELHRQPSDLKTIILTHCDIDHIGNASELKQLTGAIIAAHPNDTEIIAGKKVRTMPKSGLRFVFKLFAPFMKTKPFHVDLLLNDGDTISGLTVLHIPGHTPGSIALYDTKRKILFTGDTLGYRDGKVQGPSPNVTADITQAYQSIEKYTTLDFNIMLSGHGEPLQSNASKKVKEFLETKEENGNEMRKV